MLSLLLRSLHRFDEMIRENSSLRMEFFLCYKKFLRVLWRDVSVAAPLWGKDGVQFDS